jgi:crossover junction endodeoxyribonuclease RuvC
VLGVDPGLTATGYGFLVPGPSVPVVLDTGVIGTATDLALEARLALIHDGVDDLLGRHAPDLLVLEDLYTEYRFPRTALLMAHARGVICLAARRRRVALLPLTPGEVKRAITGNGAASKTQVQHAVQRLLMLEGPPRPSHVADALALAFTAWSRAGGRLA